MLKKFLLMVHTTYLINCFREHMKNNLAVVTKTSCSNPLICQWNCQWHTVILIMLNLDFD
ncbi:hypothetical protein Hanom_Chr01g00076201 [Helianthus anomalus]